MYDNNVINKYEQEQKEKLDYEKRLDLAFEEVWEDVEHLLTIVNYIAEIYDVDNKDLLNIIKDSI